MSAITFVCCSRKLMTSSQTAYPAIATLSAVLLIREEIKGRSRRTMGAARITVQPAMRPRSGWSVPAPPGRPDRCRASPGVWIPRPWIGTIAPPRSRNPPGASACARTASNSGPAIPPVASTAEPQPGTDLRSSTAGSASALDLLTRPVTDGASATSISLPTRDPHPISPLSPRNGTGVNQAYHHVSYFARRWSGPAHARERQGGQGISLPCGLPPMGQSLAG